MEPFGGIMATSRSKAGGGTSGTRNVRNRAARKRARAAKKTAVKNSSVKKRAVKKLFAKRQKSETAARKPAVKSASSSSRPRIVEAALAAFAHEVRTPLTGILAISSLLATSDLDERERRWVDTIRTGAEHLAALATLFVDAAKDRASGLYIRQDFFDLRAFAQASGDSLAGRAAAKGLQARIGIADDLPTFVIGDQIRLRAALENLIDNAVKFTEAGEVGLAVSAAPRGENEVSVTFAVSDSGIGISLAEIKRLFKPFSQANVSVAARFGGAGLGLSSVRQLARAMGGDVTVKQNKGGGAVFTFSVVLARASEPAAPDGDAPQAPLQGLRVLSVEDNPFGRVVLNAILTELGHRTEFIGRGELAPERVAQGDFDVVLMDMVLPGIDGIEAIARIRQLDAPHGAIGIVGVSGRQQDEAKARGAGADAFLVKPVSPRALSSALLAASRRPAGASG
ncbi:MAG: response regulator [Bradyrhizobiaceae bacterium]|nr:MAG: response regulator [Bradyrhizobiaceae bacterium]